MSWREEGAERACARWLLCYLTACPPLTFQPLSDIETREREREMVHFFSWRNPTISKRAKPGGPFFYYNRCYDDKSDSSALRDSKKNLEPSRFLSLVPFFTATNHSLLLLFLVVRRIVVVLMYTHILSSCVLPPFLLVPSFYSLLHS